MEKRDDGTVSMAAAARRIGARSEGMMPSFADALTIRPSTTAQSIHTRLDREARHTPEGRQAGRRDFPDAVLRVRKLVKVARMVLPAKPLRPFRARTDTSGHTDHTENRKARAGVIDPRTVECMAVFGAYP